MPDLCAEIKSGGVKGFLGLDQIDWGGNAGAVYEIWKLSPCCGATPNPKEAAYCVVCWWCLGPCVGSKLFASSLDQECALVPHMVCIWCCAPFAAVCMRYNLRKNAGAEGNIAGDTVCLWCCGCCSFLQQLRSVPVSKWDIIPAKVPGVVAPEVKLLR